MPLKVQETSKPTTTSSIKESKKQEPYSLALKNKKTKSRRPSTSIYKTKEEIVQKNAKKLEEEDVSNKPTEPFTYEELMKFWLEFAELMDAKGKGGMHATLSKYKPVLDEATFVVSFDVDSDLQKIEFQQQSQDFMSFLRKSLNNYSIQLSLNVLALEDSVKVHLGSKDKFLKMVEKNAALDLLRDQFNLDIEY